MITIRYQNNYGGGFAGKAEVPEETTIGDFFSSKMPGEDAGSYLIKLNGEEAPTRGVFLQENDKVSISPKKQDGG